MFERVIISKGFTKGKKGNLHYRYVNLYTKYFEFAKSSSTKVGVHVMRPAKDLNIGRFFQVYACAFDRGSTQNPIFGPVGLQVILQHFLEGFFENVIFSYFFSPVLVVTSRSDLKKYFMSGYDYEPKIGEHNIFFRP